MLKHIVLMKLKQAEAAVFNKRLLKLEKMLNNLKDQVSVVDELEVGINVSTKSKAFDIVLVSAFENEDALDKYRIHPNHILVLDYIKEVVKDIKAIDYEI